MDKYAPTHEYKDAWIKAFWLSLPPDLRVFDANANANANTEAQRIVLAREVVTKGYQIDVPIMIWGWDPYYVALQRETYGLENGAYDPDFMPKPFDPPPPPPLPDVRVVGAWQGFENRYTSLQAGLSLRDGEIREQGGVTYKKVVAPGLMGPAHYFLSQ